VARQKAADVTGNRVTLFLESEMPRLQQVDFGVPEVALVGQSAGNGEERIVLHPDHERRRLVLAEVVVGSSGFPTSKNPGSETWNLFSANL